MNHLLSFLNYWQLKESNQTVENAKKKTCRLQ